MGDEARIYDAAWFTRACGEIDKAAALGVVASLDSAAKVLARKAELSEKIGHLVEANLVAGPAQGAAAAAQGADDKRRSSMKQFAYPSLSPKTLALFPKDLHQDHAAKVKAKMDDLGVDGPVFQDSKGAKRTEMVDHIGAIARPSVATSTGLAILEGVLSPAYQGDADAIKAQISSAIPFFRYSIASDDDEIDRLKAVCFTDMRYRWNTCSDTEEFNPKITGYETIKSIADDITAEVTGHDLVQPGVRNEYLVGPAAFIREMSAAQMTVKVTAKRKQLAAGIKQRQKAALERKKQRSGTRGGDGVAANTRSGRGRAKRNADRAGKRGSGGGDEGGEQ